MGKIIRVGAMQAPTDVSKVDTFLFETGPLTLSGRSFGTPDPDRYIALALGLKRNTDDADVTSVTLGGVTATLAKYLKITSSTRGVNASIWIAYVPTGLTGDVVINSESGSVCGVIYRLTSLLSATPSDSASSGGIGTTQNLDCDVLARGVGIACSMKNNFATHTWVGLTEDVDAEVSTTAFSAASQVFSSAETPRAISVTNTNSDIVATVCAVWAPK